MSGPHSKTHLTPQQAAEAVGVSRWAIMRAINSHKLQARRDNRNRWQIDQADLEAHYNNNVRTVIEHPENDSEELREKLAIATTKIEAAERARDQAEADRDKWQKMAEYLAETKRFKWPWQA